MGSLEEQLRRTFNDIRKGTSVIEKQDVTALNKLARNEAGEIIPIANNALSGFSNDQIRYWCHQQAIYQVITKELVAFLEPITRRGAAVEICAGNGVLGKALDIACVDNHLQNRPEIAGLYFASGQPTIQYGRHVINADATEWCEKYRPDVVIASWLTERRKGGLSIGAIEGPVEEIIEEQAEFYVLIGNTQTHANKAVFKKRHYEITAPWLRSRAGDQKNNRIWIWGNWNPLMPEDVEFKYKIVY